jgi:hypothetical protein
MYSKEEICKKIMEIYPDVGACGIDLRVEYDDTERAYVVHLAKGGRRLKTYLEDGDAEKCMAGQQCVSLGIEIAQLKDTIQRM